MRLQFFLLLVLVVFTISRVKAQSNLSVYQTRIPHLFQNNFLVFNPAYAGSEGLQEVNLSSRRTSFDDRNSSFTSTLSYHGPSGADSTSAGVGMQVSIDRDSPYWKGKFGFIYAKGLQLANDVRLAAGLQISGKYLNVNYFQYKQVYPDTAPNKIGGDNDFRTDLDAGLWFTAGHFFAGGSIINLLEPSFNFAEGAARKDERELLTTAGYKFIIANGINVTPAFLMHKRELRGTRPEFNFSTSATLKFLVAGATYRGHYDSFTPWVGFVGLQIKEKIQVLISTDVPENRYEGFYKNNIEGSVRVRF